MKNLIEIKIECKGSAVGTLGWFNSIIEKSELVIKNCKDGKPGMFLKTPTEDNKFKYTFTCGVWDKQGDPEPYFCDGTFISIRAEHNEYIGWGGFAYNVTPKCKEKIEDFVETALDQFKSWWGEN